MFTLINYYIQVLSRTPSIHILLQRWCFTRFPPTVGPLFAPLPSPVTPVPYLINSNLLFTLSRIQNPDHRGILPSRIIAPGAPVAAPNSPFNWC